MGILSKLFGGGTDKVQEYKDRGAVVIDVRTASEFKSGSVKGSRNIPLQTIESRKQEIVKLNKPVILCCASGMRSGQATSILKGAGVDCVNGGSWMKVNRTFA